MHKVTVELHDGKVFEQDLEVFDISDTVGKWNDPQVTALQIGNMGFHKNTIKVINGVTMEVQP